MLDSIIPPGKKFPDGNKEYNFWSDAIDWLANHHLFGVNEGKYFDLYILYTCNLTGQRRNCLEPVTSNREKVVFS